MKRLDGKELAKQRREQLKSQVAKFSQIHGRPPCLAVVLVGEDPASQVYVRNKLKACADVGFRSVEKRLPQDISQKELQTQVGMLNDDRDIDGILVQLPLPQHLQADLVLAQISPLKDADGLDPENLGLLMTGNKRVAPCTPSGVIELLKANGVELQGQHAVVVGRSQIVGKPMAQLLIDEDATVTLCHSHSKPLSHWTQQADIVVVAAGRPQFLGQKDFKKGAVVVDVGIHRMENGKLCGDVNPEGLEDWLGALSPVPGGVGPMTITMLLENTLGLARLHQERNSQ